MKIGHGKYTAATIVSAEQIPQTAQTIATGVLSAQTKAKSRSRTSRPHPTRAESRFVVLMSGIPTWVIRGVRHNLRVSEQDADAVLGKRIISAVSLEPCRQAIGVEFSHVVGTPSAVLPDGAKEDTGCTVHLFILPIWCRTKRRTM